jgi:prephenate dehydrogenase
LLTNHENVTAALRVYAHHLDELAELIDRQDETALRAILQDAAMKRRKLF